jgi:hypothetical protein
MYPLNFPSYEFKIDRISGTLKIFDIVRKKYVKLSPEEWVRQHALHYMIHDQGYPRSLIKIEAGLRYNKMLKRSDIVVYRNTGEVFLLMECKAPTVKINQKTFDQLSIYNQHYKATHLALTNGLEHILATVNYDSKTYEMLDRFPAYVAE